MIRLILPPVKRTPAEWADSNRVLPSSAAIPGPFVSSRTPWMEYIGRAFVDPRYRRVVGCMGSQMAKTDGSLNIIGQRMDDDPVPTMYVGPSKSFVEDQMEPRLMAMIDSAADLSKKLSRGKRNKKTRKQISGVDLRLAWAGSATELAGFPAALVIVDERDRMDGNIRGEGDPVELLEARGDTYADFTMGIFSTPLIGNVEQEWDETAKIYRWAATEPELILSPTWKLWQSGTRHEWVWPCPHCGGYFVPRLNLLKWPEKATPERARKNAWIECPHCEGGIKENHKTAMNARGRPLAPGQKMDGDIIIGEPPNNECWSLWVSGLCSPWQSFGQRAQRFLAAVRSGDSGRVQTAINTAFGELYKLGGADMPAWTEIAALREPYAFDQLPDEVRKITCGVDVQSNRLVYAIRGWGERWESWLLRHGELWGDTRGDEVWQELKALLAAGTGGRMIDMMLVDSGFRPGKPIVHPTNKVYEFCRANRGRVRATKGRAKMDRPFKMSRIDITLAGKMLRSGLELWHLDTDYFKSWVQMRLDMPDDQPGKWHMSKDATDEYFRAMVSEARVVKPSGAVTWVKVFAENHLLDCESMNVAAAHMLGLHLMQPSKAVKTGKGAGSKLSKMNG